MSLWDERKGRSLLLLIAILQPRHNAQGARVALGAGSPGCAASCPRISFVNGRSNMEELARARCPVDIIFGNQSCDNVECRAAAYSGHE